MVEVNAPYIEELDECINIQAVLPNKDGVPVQAKTKKINYAMMINQQESLMSFNTKHQGFKIIISRWIYCRIFGKCNEGEYFQPGI